MAAKFKLLVINGPNLNMLGKREPEKYGLHTLGEIMSELTTAAEGLDVQLTHFQSNSEQALIERIHDAWQAVDYIIINPAAFTHTSVALRDALLSVDIPFFEVHLSNVHAREAFRHHSYFSDVAQGVVCGLGAMGYHAALNAAVSRLHNSN
ncbi:MULTISPECIES: type II 3-dehydroquinate dehydratase [unclassified Pseudoalteromonas]|uniref:type II 3-dehydroquinate dehydratase n=1 Tax=unclassified Pseudoalteromonas TaxID=194690 RepID=UPI000B66AF66|nr:MULTISPECIES: type II 3-dehydroquinate dehydratase [unclassified Pseudoalteromonas]MAJ39137.1 type II 3-dehydroquinate dehydratase [Pseudoalteromonadaceae bacterium]OUX91638.1 MAG: type II 3-dehydroquinate dehydratase [Pseudoalteromonas sp. TMED43]MDC9564313.1 type II 3-dehydroquinate dehydratase [Pseudoalteromonas sp. GAB2316C]MDC9568853.1 type II 3-dehydroquinate dehydratase [Pseudoalteromonas sp. GABNB9D]MDC9573101.1 type II 3-dehydroquinate dehydratase [Pseudoalteromonas sp. GABNS16A]